MSGKSVKLGCRGRSRAAGLLGAQSKNPREVERRTEGKGSGLDSGFADLEDNLPPPRHLSIFLAFPSVTWGTMCCKC